MAKDKKTTTNENTDISKSKAKREQRRKEVAKEKQQKLFSKAVGIAIAAVLVVIIIAAAGKSIYLAAIRTTSNSNLSAVLTSDGKIDGADMKNVLTLADYANISIPAEEVAATAEEVDDDIDATLESHKELSTDASLEIADGDEVNIDFVGTVDGVEFEGGNSNGAGYDLTIGSGLFVDDFEQQLIGHKPGEELTVEVTFPEDYNEELGGKDASFAVTVNGINIKPELTDEFVAENLSEEGVSTAAEYRASVENKFYEQHLQEYVTNYIMDNSTVNSYPSAYLKATKAVTKYNDEYMMQYLNQMGAGYENVWETQGEEINDELSYEKDLTERAKEAVKSALVYQAIYEDAGLSIDMEAVIAEMTEENGADYVANMKESYGEAYIAQGQIREAVTDYLMKLYK